MSNLRLKALVWLLRPAASGEGPEVLLLERPERRGGGLHPVTGKGEPGETPSACAAREAEEETGLRGTLVDLALSHRFRSRGGREFEEHAFALAVAAGAEPRLSDEHVAWRWGTPEDARRAGDWPWHRTTLEAALRSFRV